MTLQAIKDQIARNVGHADWDLMRYRESEGTLQEMWNLVCERYAYECMKDLEAERDKLKSELLTRDAVWLPAKDAEIDKLKRDLEDSQKVITGLREENSRIEAERVQGNLDSFEGYKQMQSEIDSLKKQLKAAEDRIPSKPCAKN